MPRQTRRGFLKASTVAAAGFAGLAGCLGDDDEITTLRYNYVVPVEALSTLQDVPEIRDELENIGEEYELEIDAVPATPDAVAAMAGGEIDMAFFANVSFARTVLEEAVPGGVTAIALEWLDAYPGHYGLTGFSHPDSQYQEPEDIEGARIGVNALGTGTMTPVIGTLHRLGLTRDDVAFEEVAFPDMLEAIQEDLVDIGVFPPIFAGQPRGEGFTPAFSSHFAFDEPYPFAFMAASNDMLEEKEDAFETWAADYVELWEFVHENRDMVVSSAAEHFDIPEPAIDGFYLREETDYFRQLEFDISRFDEHLNELVDLGFIDEGADFTEHVTNEFVS